MDGVTVGRPRCNIPRCVGRLNSPRDRFCGSHSWLASVCAIDGCNLPCTDGMRTCATKAHRDFETKKRERGQAIFRLKRRLKAHEMGCPPAGQGKPQDLEELYVLDDPDVAASLVDSVVSEPLDLADLSAALQSSSDDDPSAAASQPPALPADSPYPAYQLPTAPHHLVAPASEAIGLSPADGLGAGNSTSPVEPGLLNPSVDGSRSAEALPPSPFPADIVRDSSPGVSPSAPGPTSSSKAGSDKSKRRHGASNKLKCCDTEPLTWKGIRAWTHNEQLCVRCCGVVVSRATFYNAESVSNCAVCEHISTSFGPVAHMFR